jgi:hypothetical protein
MNPTRFDRLTRWLATGRMSRRTALAVGGAGIASAGLAATGLAAVAAQDATPAATPAAWPADPHPSADTAQTHPEHLFVQPFDAGAWAPKPGEDGVYTLTLTGVAAYTTYFADRPERDTGLASTQPFLDGLGFAPENPPNAALVAQTGAGETDVLVVELFDPVYDADAATLTYEAKVLSDYGGRGLANLARQQQDYELDETFGEGSLFIDGCPDSTETCWAPTSEDDPTCVNIGSVASSNCWNDKESRCEPCGNSLGACNVSHMSSCKYRDSQFHCYDDISLCGAPGCCAANGGCTCPF